MDLLEELAGLDQLTATLTVIIGMMESEEGNTLSLETYSHSLRAVRDGLDKILLDLRQKET